MNAVIVTLTWLVYPTPRTDEPSKTPLELVVTIGDQPPRTLKLKPQLGDLKPYNQPLCTNEQPFIQYPFERGEVAKTAFYEGGAGGYLVRRSGDTLVIAEWEQSDGACDGKHHELVACPRTTKIATRIAIPKGSKIREQLFEIDRKGARHAFECKS